MPPMIRLYISETTPVFAAGLVLVLNPDQGRYLTQVMRLKVGNELAVFNGRDGEWLARIDDIGKKLVRLALVTQTRIQPSASGPTLAIALVKRTALEYIVEKATELGVKRIQLLLTQRANAGHTNVERLVSIAKESAEQTERLDIPDIITPVKLNTFMDQAGFQALVFADEESTHETDDRGTPPMLNGLRALPKEGETVILIGPEGGFSPEERNRLRGMANCHPVNLGPRILRADTAAISALTLYQAAMGDWR